MNIIETNFKYREGMGFIQEVNYLIIHHSASTRDLTPEEIHQIHLAQSPQWKGFGYHFYIRKDGTVYRGRREKNAGSHCEGYNSVSLGICLSGNFEVEEPTVKQLNSLKTLIKELHLKYPKATIHSHSDFNATACCGKNLRKYLNDLEKQSFIKIFANNGKISLVFENGNKITKQFYDNKELLNELQIGIKFEV